MFFWRKIGLLWRKDIPEETTTCTKETEVKPLTEKKLREAIAVMERMRKRYGPPIKRIECSPAFFEMVRREVPKGKFSGLGQIILLEKKGQEEPYKIIRNGGGG